MADTTLGAIAPARGVKSPGRLRRRYSLLTRRDKMVLAVMVAIPTLIQLIFIWIPTVLSILLSFVRWNGLAFSDIRPAGTANYEFVFKDYPSRRCSTTSSGSCS